ncbi:MAG: carboxypeptidase regulatory-like domain-containing protein, partial [Desulfobacteraceae bacterium]|nr:carboxypeptidase regulatory-like domain-containing protein [Desulfobacteraceae bacterium]
MRYKSKYYYFVICLGIITLGFSVVPSAKADVAQGLAYLRSQQRGDGSYRGASDIATAFQTTAESLRTFRFAGGSSQAETAAAIAFLNRESCRNTEHLARLIAVNVEAGNNTQVLIDELLRHQNYDGGFGDFEDYDSTILDTAFALEALALAGQSQTNQSGLAVDFLIRKQLSAGGWQSEPNTPSVYLSALAMRSLWHYRTLIPNVSGTLIRAQNFLLSQRNSLTGLWPATFESALALIAIIPNVNEFSQVVTMVNALRNLQQTNGSWDDNTYTTALAVRALASQPVQLPLPATTGGIEGKVLDSTTRQPINGASVTVDGLTMNALTDLNGNFSLNDLGAAAYTVRIAAAGYLEAFSSGVVVNAGTKTILGDSFLSSLPNFGVLQGEVHDAQTGQALANVAVLVSGGSTASTNTGSNGGYRLAGLSPGPITITVTLNGYSPATATATVVAGKTVLYNPSLTPTTSENVPLPGTPTTGVLRGQVTNSNNGTPVASAYVSVENAATGFRITGAYTNTNGNYEILNLQPGDIILQISKSGFTPTVAHGSVNAGNALLFSPALVPETGNAGTVEEQPLPITPTTGILRGTVSDANTGMPLAVVNVSINQAASGQRIASVYTDTNGTYELTDLAPGAIAIQAGKTGYLTATGTATLQAGVALLFNPGLVPEGGNPGNNTVTIIEEPV